MSQDFMDAELFADFIVEAKEHLETIEPNLLELEKAPDNLGLLNEIFRPMHSLKGASGFLGLNRMNQLAHKCENILDDLRRGAMVVTSEIMDVILASTDALRQMIDNLEATNTEGGVEIEHLIAQIDAIMAGDIPPPAVPQTAEKAGVAEIVTEQPLGVVAEESAFLAQATTEPLAELSPPAAEETAPLAVAQPASGELNTSVVAMTPKEWIAQLPLHAPYALTAFGEGHLKDFIDESLEIVENLNAGLLRLEEEPTGQDELVNDIFRFFHNLKGNSGIIGYQELNGLTHEAETLLNNVRKGEMTPSHELIDLLLFVVDIMEFLVHCIDPIKGSVLAPDPSEVLVQLQQALAGGEICLPRSMYEAMAAEAEAEAEPEASVEPEAAKPAERIVEVVNPTIYPVGTEGDDDEVFRITVRQQMEIIRAGISTLHNDSSHRISIDAIYRSLIAVKNACGFVSLTDIKIYAERTAGIVDSARNSDMDFGLLLDMLSQEVAIIQEMLDKAQPGADIDAPAAPATDKTASPPAEEAPLVAQETAVATDEEPANSDTIAAHVEADTSTTVADEHDDTHGESTSEVMPDPAIKIQPATDAPAQEHKEISVPVAPPVASKPQSSKAPAPHPAAVKPATSAPRPATPAPPSAPAAGASSEAPKGSSTIRVDHEKLDHLMNLIGELIINRNRYSLIARHLEEGGPEMDVSQVAQSLTETTYAMARISDDLQDTIMKVRMVPVASVFSRFPRLVRDLSRKSGKEVDLILEGEETELDKSVVEVIGDPLVHLIRNAVDHGVESEAERLAKGKTPKGRVVLRAYHRGNSVAIEIEDDGNGIDPEKMREVAVRKGILGQDEARQLDDREAMELIFAPGFSSAEKITDISGRGVGMDVVRTNIKNLKGSVNISSEVGKGTRFTLSLPLTLAIIDALMVNVSGEMYAIPLDAVSETTKIESCRLTDVKGRKAVTLRGEVLGVIELAELLNLPRNETLPEVLSVVVIHDNDRRLGLVVDRLLERQEIVIKPLGSYLGDLNGISGATIMGDGSVILILDPHEVYLMATSRAIS